MDREEKKKGLCDSEKSCQRIEVPTEDELAALNAMMAIKDRVREIKKLLSDLSSSEKNAEKISGLEKKLARLKKEWKELERKREEATRERMILLGHEKS